MAAERRSDIEQGPALGQLIYDLRTEVGLSQRELAARMRTTQSLISRLEECGGARNCIDSSPVWRSRLDATWCCASPSESPSR
ncbi:MAG: helix-turn-helix transcriptional regulator [Propionibacteriaceae bacterium]|nr:helix-turn-helix transcriptional regulator [Propionibacteriaceae bacterium]